MLTLRYLCDTIIKVIAVSELYSEAAATKTEVFMENKKRVFGDPDTNRKNYKLTIKRCFKLLDYLKSNTDNEHTITQAELRRDEEISGYLGSKDTFNKMVRTLSMMLNTDGNDKIKPEEEWRLVYKAFRESYGEIDAEAEIDTEADIGPSSVRDIYYNHVFTNDEITEIINALRMSKTADNDTCEKIIEKIKRELVSKHYKEYSCRIYNSEYTDSDLLDTNLSLIQQAISKRQQLSYRMNYYNSKKRLVPVRKTEKVISPHYIVTNAGRFYVIGCFEGENKTLCIIRIDLMSDVKVLKKTVTPPKEIQGLPDIMENDFKSLQLNMSYDSPIPVRIRITKKLTDSVIGAQVTNHTFVHDIFGDEYSVISSDSKGDVIRVKCPPFAIKNLAMQYSDVVEVLEPERLRNEIKDMIRRLNEKYDV